jgi:hypothetical protein
MGLFNHFPYPDTHQLNLDWILETVKGCMDKVTELWTYVKEPGSGIQKALTDAQAAATTAQTSAADAQTSVTNAQKFATDAQNHANNAGESADLCAEYLNGMQAMMGKLYPVGAVYVNYRNQAMPVESDTTVIARLKALTGGTWTRAGSHGQPVTASGQMGWATVILGNAAGDAVDTNFNIYVRTA